ncbi:MAG TPA: hypothetical protein VF627_03360 [Abditibacterium sp.]
MKIATRKTTRRKSGAFCLLGALVSLVSPLLQPAAHAFGGEDLLEGPFHHEEITEKAAMAAKWSFHAQTPGSQGKTLKFQPKEEEFKAAEVVAWHADFVDSYLYNPLWWAKSIPQTGLRRAKAALASQKQLEAVHFDDLFDSQKVNHTWRRYTSGAMAGLIDAWKRNDVPAAQNIVGVSLHAMQDFYTHSNWIDKAERRDKTLFNLDLPERARLPLYTGAYEHEEHLGVKSHGKFLLSCAAFNQPGVKQVMQAACGPLGPLGDQDICKNFDSCGKGVPVQPKIGGITAPNKLIFMQPGMAIDNGWAAHLGVKERGLDISGDVALKTTLGLAEKQSVLWLQLLGEKMNKIGAGSFWNDVTQQAPSVEDRYAQFEDFKKFPYQFLSAGEYPASASNREEFFLRVNIKTGSAGNAGTDADIKAMFDQGAERLADYSPRRDPITGHNDHEKGAEAVYAFGPFNTLPKKLTLRNDSASTWEAVKKTGEQVVKLAAAPFKLVWNAGKAIIGTEADYVGTAHRVFEPEELAQIGASEQLFQLPVRPGENGNSPDGGDWNVTAYIRKTGDSGDIGAGSWSEYKVRLSKLICNKQAKSDRGSASNEPFILGAASALPGPLESMKSPVFGDVKGRDKTKNPTKDSQRDINHEFQTFRVPKEIGRVNVAICVMESDDESEKKRVELRQKFVEQWKDAKAQERTWLETIGAATAEDWQLGEVEVTAWTRNGQVKVGVIHKSVENKWIKGGKSLPIDFNNPGGLLTYNITTEELMPFIRPDGSPAPETPTTPTTPTEPTIPSGPSSAQLALLDKFVGKWQANFGVLTLAREGDKLRGVYRRVDPMSRVEGNAETIELSASADATRVEGPVTFGQTTYGAMNWSLGADGDTFAGTYNYNGVNSHSGRRIKDGTLPGTPTTPTTPTIPPTLPNIPTTPTNPPTLPNVPGTGGQTGGLDDFRPLGDWNVKIDAVRVARGNQIEVVTSYKNVTARDARLSPSDVNMIITDADGAGIKSIGNLYGPGPQPGASPQQLSTYPTIAKDTAFQTVALFDIPRGATPLKTLTVFGYGAEPLTLNIENVTLPAPIPTVARPIPGAVAAGDFVEFGDYDVRVDGVKKGRNNTVHVFLTLKNVGDKAIAAPAGNLNVSISDTNLGVRSDDGNTYRASGSDATPTRIERTVNIVPGGEFAVRYVVPMLPGTIAKMLKLDTYGDKIHSVELPALP